MKIFLYEIFFKKKKTRQEREIEIKKTRSLITKGEIVFLFYF
jgi:hypothetical protein